MRTRLLSLVVVCLFACPAALCAEASPAMRPDVALAILKEGNRRFVGGYRQAHGEMDELRRRLAHDGQRPLAAVVACSDSREPVEYIFDQPLGGLFVIRTAGNAAGVQSLGSVQYAVRNLNVPLVVVLGHTHCGAVHAVAAGYETDGMLEQMLKPIAETAAASAHADEAELTRLNVRAAVAAMLEQDAVLAERAGDGAVLVLGALYDIETGTILWLD